MGRSEVILNGRLHWCIVGKSKLSWQYYPQNRCLDDDDTDDEGYATGDDDESSVDVPVPSLSHKKAKGKLKMRRAKRTVTFDLFDNENDTDGIDNDERDSLSEYSPDDLPIC